MKHIELYEKLEERYPAALRCEWDNDGIMCMAKPDREVKKVLVTLDITEGAVQKAVKEDFDLVLSHHPLIFRRVAHLDIRESVPRRLLMLAEKGITALSYHTRLDAAENGVNDILAKTLGLTDIVPLIVDGVPMGRIGKTQKEFSPREFALYAKEKLSALQAVMADGGKPISRVAVVGGSAEEGIAPAKLMGADAFVTGEAKYHTLSDAHLGGISVIALGHYETEEPVCSVLAEAVKTWVPEAEIEIYSANTLIRL